jgi:hypothetical protein
MSTKGCLQKDVYKRMSTKGCLQKDVYNKDVYKRMSTKGCLQKDVCEWMVQMISPSSLRIACVVQIWLLINLAGTVYSQTLGQVAANCDHRPETQTSLLDLGNQLSHSGCWEQAARTYKQVLQADSCKHNRPE